MRSHRRAAKPQQRRDRAAAAGLAGAVREATKGAIAGGHEHYWITAKLKMGLLRPVVVND
jgi:hypothetical protein